jgi:SagB-type dehydrogenase family enzyme
VPGLGRRGFLRLAAAGVLARPGRARAGADETPSAYDVHRATRNTWHGPTAIGSLLTERPRPDKPYPGAPRIALPRGDAFAPVSLAAAAQGSAPARAFSGEPLALGALASLLKLTNGVTGLIPGSDPPELRRAAPSAGALYAGEVYVVAERVAGLAPGVYSYAVAEHALVSIRSGRALGEVAHAASAREAIDGAACAVLLSNVFRRYAWRYGQRGYRYALIDSGHIGENLRLAAAAAGLGHASPLRFADDALNALLAIDGREEAVCALHALGARAAPRGGEPSRVLVEKGGADRSLTEVERYHEATKLAWGAAAGPAPGARAEIAAPAGALRLAAAPAPTLPVTRAIQQRRSARGFREEAIAQEALGFALELARSPGLALRLVVHRVQGLAPGIYDAAAGERMLAEVRSGSFERALVRACLFQEKAGTAAVAFTWLADLRSPADGERHYRDRLLEAGAAAERVYLAAESLGLAARNLAGFFDDSLNDLLGTDGRERAAVHLTLLGPGITLPS